VVVIDERYKRPAEVDLLLGDASKARRVLGWGPVVDFRMLAKGMCVTDEGEARREAATLRRAA
jgi:GDPmannose 4,6-dehydratase